MGLSDEDYLLMLKECELVRGKKNRWGVNREFRLNNFKQYLADSGLPDAEIDAAEVTCFSKQAY